MIVVPLVEEFRGICSLNRINTIIWWRHQTHTHSLSLAPIMFKSIIHYYYKYYNFKLYRIGQRQYQIAIIWADGNEMRRFGEKRYLLQCQTQLDGNQWCYNIMEQTILCFQTASLTKYGDLSLSIRNDGDRWERSSLIYTPWFVSLFFFSCLGDSYVGEPCGAIPVYVCFTCCWTELRKCQTEGNVIDWLVGDDNDNNNNNNKIWREHTNGPANDH